MSSATPSQENQGQLGLWSTISIIVGIVIGTSIFAFPIPIFNSTPNVWMGLAVWLFGGVLALLGGLCYAELATTYPRDGGDYYYLTRAFGPWVGFLFGWAQIIVILPASIGVMAVVFASRATALHPLQDFANLGLSSEFYYAAGAILAITLLNAIGVVLGKVAQNLLTFAKVIGIGAILVCGFMHAQPELTDWKFPSWATDPTEPSQWGWGSLAIILVLYAYGGWNDAAFVAAEVRDPRRNIPRALILGIGAIALIYVLVNLAYILGLGWAKVRDFDTGSLPAAVLNQALGERGALAMNVIVMISALGAANGLIFVGSRIYAMLGSDHRLFGFLGHWSPGKGAPILALLVQALITIGLVLLFGTERGHAAINQFLDWLNGSLTHLAHSIDEEWIVQIDYKKDWKPDDAFDALISHSAPAFWVFFLLTGFSLFVLREKNPTLERPFSVPLYPLVPIIFCNMCVYMLYRSILYIEWRTLFVVAVLLIGLPLYWLSRLLGGPPPR